MRKGRKGATVLIIMLMAAATADPLPSADCSIRQEVTATAKEYLGTGYRYGGTGSRGFDCSGFVRHVFLTHGFNLPRISRDQYLQSRKISPGRIRAGDLVFFKISGNRISHVGISLGKDRFIHAPRTGKKVRIASMKISYWKKRFAGAGTFIHCR